MPVYDETTAIETMPELYRGERVRDGENAADAAVDVLNRRDGGTGTGIALRMEEGTLTGVFADELGKVAGRRSGEMEGSGSPIF
jgi:hypothetical protein